MTVFDKLNQKYGGDTLFLAAQGTKDSPKESRPTWGMKRDYLTPQYTTKWRDIPSIQC